MFPLWLEQPAYGEDICVPTETSVFLRPYPAKEVLNNGYIIGAVQIPKSLRQVLGKNS